MSAFGRAQQDEREPLQRKRGLSCYSRDHGRTLKNAEKPRKVPVKVDPKVFFANERTFLAWLHMALILGGMAIAIITFSGDSASAIYGLVLLPVSIAFILYALSQYYVRAQAMRQREPGPYDDRNGPMALGTILICATLANVLLHIIAKYS